MKTLNILWQLPQYFVSLAVLTYFSLSKRVMKKHRVTGVTAKHSSVYYIRGRHKRAFSSGEIIFVYSGYQYGSERYREVVRHEYGHAMQSACLGWLYLPVIGLPSLLVTGISSSLAEKCYFEKWADELAAGVDLKIIDT
ncbi:MAG: hypothetical protein LBL33_08710 [Tannerella sp.]|jgi:hypothetical protein|nr:hypothetical protein [Tannerella sp.]